MSKPAKKRDPGLEDENEPTQGETEIATSEFHILTDSELTEEQLEMIKIICELSKKKEKITNVQGRSGVILAGWLANKKGPVQVVVDEIFNHTR